MFKKVLSLLVLVILFTQCSSSKNSSKTLQKEITESYCQTWISGVAPASSGMNFFVNFSPYPELEVDSFIVNGYILQVETTTGEDGLLIIGRHTTPANFENPEKPFSNFYSESKYSGKILLRSKTKSFWVKVDSFEKRAPNNLP